jgi:hypothetical protein
MQLLPGTVRATPQRADPLRFRSLHHLVAALLPLGSLAAQAPAIPRAHLPVHLEATRLRVFDANDSLVELFPFRITLANAEEPDTGRRIAQIPFELHEWGPTDHDQRDSTWTAGLKRIFPLGNYDLAGYIVTRSLPDFNSWQLGVRQMGEDAHGAQAGGNQEPIGRGPIVISDMVLGSAYNGIEWQRGTQRVLVGVSHVFDRHGPIHIYYQLRSAMAVSDAHIDLTVANLSTRKPAPLTVHIGSKNSLAPGVADFERMLDTSHLPPGRYRLDIRVRAPSGALAAERSTTMVLQ